MDNEFVQAYLKVFPHVRPSIFQLEMIVGRITDRDAWNHTLEFWAGNDFRAQSIFKMCHYYDEFIQNRKGNLAQVGKWNGESDEIDVHCVTCADTGKLYTWPEGKTSMLDVIETPCPNCTAEAKAA